MVYYFLIFLASLLIDTIPFIGPPAWIVMVYFQMRFGLNIWWVLIWGVIGSTIGRYLLTLYVPWITSKVVNNHKDKDLEFLGNKLNGNIGTMHLIVFIYTLLPIPTTPIFMSLGMSKVKVYKVMPTFFIGKFLSDMYMVYSGKLVAQNIHSMINGIISWKGILATFVCLLFLAIMLFTDWRTLLTEKKYKLRFDVWR